MLCDGKLTDFCLKKHLHKEAFFDLKLTTFFWLTIAGTVASTIGAFAITAITVTSTVRSTVVS